MNITRRKALLLGAAASAAGFAGWSPVLGADGDIYDVARLMQPDGLADRAVLGAPDAPVSVIEYAAPTCPHCAAFHARTLPALKTNYIETGKIRFILRPFIINVLDAVVFMLAYSQDDDESFHNVINTYFEQQAGWARSENARDAMLAVALQLGFSEESFDQALTNQQLFAGMQKIRQQALSEFDLVGTPTFYVNGKMASGNQSIEQMAAKIDPLLS